MSLVALPQEGAWSASPGSVTPGDSVRISASFPVVPGTSVRLERAAASDETVVLVDPEVAVGDNVARVSFTVAIFVPGRRLVPTPALEMVAPSGVITNIPAGSVAVEVGSVLPDTGHPEPKPGFSPIRREVRRLEPLVFLELAVVFLAFGWWKVRTRPPVVPPQQTVPPEPATAPVAAWAAAGEVSAAAEIARHRLHSFLASRTAGITVSSTTAEILEALAAASDELPYREIRTLFGGLDAAAFAPTHGAEVAHLAGQVDDLIADLSRADAPGEPEETA